MFGIVQVIPVDILEKLIEGIEVQIIAIIALTAADANNIDAGHMAGVHNGADNGSGMLRPQRNPGVEFHSVADDGAIFAGVKFFPVIDFHKCIFSLFNFSFVLRYLIQRSLGIRNIRTLEIIVAAEPNAATIYF